MNYTESNLLPGEEVVYRAWPHPIVYASSLFFGVLGLFALIGALVAFRSAPDALQFLTFAAAAFGLLAIVLAVTARMRIVNSEFAVTNRRVLIKVGWVSRRSFEMVLSKIEGIGVDQTVLGRWYDFGTIVIRGTGGSREPFTNIANPLEFRRQVQLVMPVQ